MTTAKRPTTESTAAPKVPDWVKETPEECSYNLTMYDDIGGSVQQVDLTRSEYEALKQHLAVLREHTTKASVS